MSMKTMGLVLMESTQPIYTLECGRLHLLGTQRIWTCTGKFNTNESFTMYAFFLSGTRNTENLVSFTYDKIGFFACMKQP